MANIELNVVALGNFKQLESQLASLKAELASVNSALASNQISLSTKQVKGLSDAFHTSMMESNLFTSKLVSMSTAAEHLGQRIAKGRTNMADFKQAMQSVSKETSLYNQLGQRQVAMQEAMIQNLGGGMARVYAQHHADLSNSVTRTRVLTEGIIAQNAALKASATHIVNWGKNTQWAGRQLTAGLTMPIALFAAGIAKMFNEVDANLTRLEKVYGIGLQKPTQQLLNNVRKDVLGLAKDLGHELGVTSAEVTDTAAQFAAAGLTGKQLTDATRQASRIVVLGETDKQEAIKATIALQTAYKLNNAELTESVNFFNAAQAATSTSMSDLVEAVPRVGPVIKGLGGSYKDMVAILTALKEGGVPAGEAANAIKTSLGRLINPTKAAQERLTGFGIDINSVVTKNAGNLVGMITDLQAGLDKLSSLDRQKAIAELFGKFQFARMTALMDNFGKTGTQSAKIMEMMGMSAAELASIADDQTKKIQQSASGRFKIAVEDLKNTLLPLGEVALKTFSGLINTLTGFFDTISNLPGPVKTVMKAFGAIAVVAGPIIMITGLFGNLIGMLGKGLVNFRSIFTAVRNGINPMSVLGKKFQLHTEESVAAANAEELFGEKISKNLSPIEAVTRAIMAQVEALQALQAQMSGTSASTLATSPVSISSQPGKGYASSFFGSQVANAPGTGQNSTIARRSVSGTLILPTLSKAISKQGALGSSLLMYSNQKEQGALMARGREVGLNDEETKQLIISKKKMLELEARYIASLKMLNSENAEFLSKYTVLQNEYLAELQEAGSDEDKKQAVNKKHQTRLNKLLDSEEQFRVLTNEQLERQNAALKSGTTVQRVFAENLDLATKETRRIYKTIPKLNDAMDRTGWTMRSAAQKFATGLTVMLESTSKGFGAVTRSHVVAAEALDKEFVEIEKSTTAIKNNTRSKTKNAVVTEENTIAEENNTNANNQDTAAKKGGRFGKLNAGKIGGGIGMAASMGTMFTGGDHAASQSLMLGSMGMMMTNNPYLQGASVAIAATMYAVTKLNEESEKLGKTMTAAFSTGAAEAEMLGIELHKIGTLSIPSGNAALDEQKSKIDQLTDSLNSLDAADPLKTFVDSLSSKDTATQVALLQQKYLTLRVQGVDDKEAREFVQAIMRAGGIEFGASRGVNAAIGSVSGENPLVASQRAGTKLALSTGGASRTNDLQRDTSIAAGAAVTGEAIAAGLAMAGVATAATGVGAVATPFLEAGAGIALVTGYTVAGIAAVHAGMVGLQGDSKILSDFAEAGTHGGNSLLHMGANADRLRKAIEGNAQQLHALSSTASASELDDYLLQLQTQMKDNADEANFFAASVGSMFEQAGEAGKEMYRKMQEAGVSATSELQAYQLTLKGYEVQLDGLDGKQIEIEIHQLVKRDELINVGATSYSGIEDYLSKNPNQKTSYNTVNGRNISVDKFDPTPYDRRIAKEKAAIELIKAQREERQKILEAQKRSIEYQKQDLEYAKSKLGLENQLREAMASGNLLKAAELRQQISVSNTDRVNQLAQRAADEKERKKQAAEDAEVKRHEKEIARQEALKKAAEAAFKAIRESASVTTHTMKDAFTDAYDKIDTIFANTGKVGTKELKALATGIHEKFGLPVDTALASLKNYRTILQSNPDVKWGKNAADDLKPFIDAQTNSAILASFINLRQDSANANKSDASLYVQAINAAGKVGGYTAKIKNGNIIVKNTASGKSTNLSVAGLSAQTGTVVMPPTTQPSRKPSAGQASAGTWYEDPSRDGYYWLLGTGNEWDDRVQTALPRATMESKENRGYFDWSSNGWARKKATGGYISGAGSWTSDSIPAMLSNGEFVVKASSVARYGVPMLDAINKGHYSMGGYAVPTAKYADGGFAGSNATINAVFNISGPDAGQVADQAIKKLELLMKKNGAVTRI